MQSIVDQLRERIETARCDRGCFATRTLIDELLPHGCFRRGTLVELFGSGTALAVVLAREALRPVGMLAVIDPARRFYPPALVNIGIDLDRLVVVQPDEPDWVAIQALSCPAIDAVLCWPDRLGSKTFRRWQLAAERGGSVGLLVRPSTARGSPSWADVQLIVTPLAMNRWRLEVADRSLDFSIDDQGRIHDCLRVVSELADPTAAARAARV
jgi:protein ImuA